MVDWLRPMTVFLWSQSDEIVRVRRDVELSRTCPCGATLRATVSADGEATRKAERWKGDGPASVFLDEAATAHEAVAEAEASAREHGRELLDLVPCPRCALRPGRVALQRRLVVAALPRIMGGLAFGAIFGLALSLDAQSSRLGLLLGSASVLGGLLWAAVEVRKVWQRWNDAARRVLLQAAPYR